MERLNGKVAIVTGASSGIGRAIAIMLAREGACVVLADRDSTGGLFTRDGIVATGGKAEFFDLDVTDEARWAEVIDFALVSFGGLDTLVNNAGIVLMKLLAETTLADWQKVFQVNAEGVFLGTRIAMTAMRRLRGGSIVNITSTMATVPSAAYAAYCASKAAATQFTKVAALDGAAVQPLIRVNCVHPGVIATPMIESEIHDYARRSNIPSDTARNRFGAICPLGLGEPDDIAYGVVYLASDESKFVTGSELPIDGGHLIGART